jgi:hypothetical protein
MQGVVSGVTDALAVLPPQMRDPASLNGGGSVIAVLFADALGEG